MPQLPASVAFVIIGLGTLYLCFLIYRRLERMFSPWPARLPALQHDCSKKHVVVFIHGFNSSPDCWIPFVTLLGEDAEVFENHALVWHQYPTGMFGWSPFRRIPRLSEVGESIQSIWSELSGYEEVIFVGHSQGGLAIQSFFAHKFAKGEGKELAKVKAVIFFATPNFGSPLLGSLRRLLYAILPNPQESTLRALNSETGTLCRSVARRVLWASEVTKESCPIPITAFWGMEDRVVPEASARGCVEEGQGLPGNHSGVITPDRKLDDPRYLALKRTILSPVGHPELLLVDKFSISLEVFPRDPNEDVIIHDKPHAGGDNCARRRTEIRVAKNNRCSTLYEIKYRSNQGVVRSLGVREPNQASPADLSANEALASMFNYSFRPEPGESYYCHLEIFNGFGAGNRDWHHHFPHHLRCREFELTLNLQGYLDQGAELTLGPVVRHMKNEVHDHSLCAERERLLWPTVTPVPAGPGIWKWSIFDMRAGVVDLRWDLKMPEKDISWLDRGREALRPFL